MKVAVFGKKFEPGFIKSVFTFFSKLNDFGTEIYVYKSFYEFLSRKIKYRPTITSVFQNCNDMPEDIDIFFSLGGDGTFLQAMRMVKDRQIPIAGINTGRLGFLADISQEEIEEAMDMIHDRKYSLEDRSLLQVTTNNNLFGEMNFALNELTIHKKDSSSMITIHTYLNDNYLNSYWADGLIISTPTGSTAYSLSTGGPIVVPDSNNFIITPIAPHNLNVRPLVVSDKNKVRLRVEGRKDSFLATLDYQSKAFNSAVELIVEKADFTVKILKLDNHDFFTTLRGKLMWGADKRN